MSHSKIYSACIGAGNCFPVHTQGQAALIRASPSRVLREVKVESVERRVGERVAIDTWPCDV